MQNIAQMPSEVQAQAVAMAFRRPFLQPFPAAEKDQHADDKSSHNA